MDSSALLPLVQEGIRAASEEEDDAKRAKKRRVRRACIYCNRSHMSCDTERPCKRCVSRGIAHMCRDSEAPKRRGRKGSYLEDGRPIKDDDVEERAFDRVSISSLLSNPSPAVYAQVSLQDSRNTNNQQLAVSEQDVPNLQTDIDIPYDLRTILGDLMFSSIDQISGLEKFCEPDGSDIKRQEEEHFTKLMNSLHTTFIELGEEVDKMLINLKNVRAKIRSYIRDKFKVQFDWAKSLEDMRSEIDSLVTMYRSTFESLAIPFLIWDRSGTIHYASPAFRLLLCFVDPLPTKKEDWVLWRLFSTEGFKTYMKCALELLTGYPDNLNDNFFLTTVGFKKNFNTPNESIVDGTLSLTIRRDPVGLPFLVIGCFLPKVSTTITFK